MLSIGLMSGTSMDGVDAALLETDGLFDIRPLAHVSLSYDPPFKKMLQEAALAVKDNDGNLGKAAEQYNRHHDTSFSAVMAQSTDWHRLAVVQLLKEAGYAAPQMTVIGLHGQTLYHQPEKGLSVIIGDGKSLAQQLRIPVVNDFRQQDIAAGGLGAPLAPIYHQALAVRDQTLPLIVVNCGGIANITVIRNAACEELIGFDTGPGNSLIDRFVTQRTHGAWLMDANARFGQDGKINHEVLRALHKKAISKHNGAYLQKTPPKALDIGDLQLIPELDALTLADGCRTLEVFTAETIANSLALLPPMPPCHWVLAGGGASNPVIYHALKDCLHERALSVELAETRGWHRQALEAQLFAYLAVRHLKGLPLSVPGTTGVPKPLSGGTYWHYSGPQ